MFAHQVEDARTKRIDEITVAGSAALSRNQCLGTISAQSVKQPENLSAANTEQRSGIFDPQFATLEP